MSKSGANPNNKIQTSKRVEHFSVSYPDFEFDITFTFAATMQTVYLKIFGTVQGVFFRQSTQQKALQLGIRGWVRNCDDDTVEAEAEGGEEALKNFVEWCHHGPSRAVVTKVEIKNIDLKNYSRFEVRR
jgi:acylphosphatase